MERAEQTGDFNAYVALWTRDRAAKLENLRPSAKASPAVTYRAMKTTVSGDDAVLYAQSGPSSFITLKLRKEGGEWKIQDEQFSDTAPASASAVAALPPGPGAFVRAGSPWNQVPEAMDRAQASRQGFQLKAVFDESYLYIRIESSTELPAPGSTIQKPPGGWPILKIATSDAAEFVLYDAVNVGDQATFDSSGKATSHRPFAAYMIRLERNGQQVFSASADLKPSPLLQVAGRDYDIRIPWPRWASRIRAPPESRSAMRSGPRARC